MKNILLTMLLLLVGILPMSAQYYRINYDAKTIAAMSGAYGTEAAAEAYYNQQVKDILKHYQSAEVAATGIYASKYLDRKALTYLGIWASSEENYYYRRIYNMVSAKIMPKIWDVSGLMLKHPQNALYWGSYLMKTCNDTKNLCMQFESVVTNSRLSFRDIAFLEMTPEVANIFNLVQMGGTDWKTLMNDFGNIRGNFTKENLTADIDKLYNTGLNIISQGGTNVSNQLLGQSSFNDVINGKTSAISNLVQGSYGMFNNLQNNLGGTLMGIVGDSENVNKLFNFSNYNLTSWITDYNQEAIGRYYTQRWYIYRRDYGSQILCNYEPPTDDNSIINGSHWYRINTTDPNFYPNTTQTEQILQNSESHAGWSRSRVAQLNQSKDGYDYNISYWRSTYIISRNKKQTKKAYAYYITVTKDWDRTEEVFEDYFDSYSMDLNTFKAQLNARLSELNDNENGYTYYIGYDSRNYYQATDAAKLKGCETVIISVTCTDGVSLGEGTTQYKCRQCGGSPSSHTKECAMQTTLPSDNNLDLSELDKQESEARNHISMLQSQINSLESANATIIKQISKASIEEAARLRQKYNENKTKITSLQSELNEWTKKLDDILQAKNEASQDNATATDDYYRIPAIMNDCKNAYNLTWQSNGWWEGYTYYRKASMPNIRGEVTFKATISIARKPKYFLGIKIHRAIVQISWSLSGEYSDTEVVDMLELNPEQDEATKTRIVNNRISEIARQYPNCKVSTEYIKNEPQQTDDTEDTYHLLWSSDRLEIAREIDSRITKIYADLVSLERMMYYRLSISDLLRQQGFQIDRNQGRHLELLDACHHRWMENAINHTNNNDDDNKEEKKQLPIDRIEPTTRVEYKPEEDHSK